MGKITNTEKEKIKRKLSQPKAPEVRFNYPLADLKPDPKNDRVWSAEALAGLRLIIAELGYVEPIIVNEKTGLMVGGHMRLQALKADGQTHAPFVVIGSWAAMNARALSEALNNPATQGRYVLKKSRRNLDELKKALPDLYVQLGLGGILETAAAQEESSKKVTKIETDESMRTVKIKLPLSAWNSHLEAMARAGELCVQGGTEIAHLTEGMLLEKIEAEFLTQHGHAQTQPKYSEDKPKKKKKAETE